MEKKKLDMKIKIVLGIIIFIVVLFIGSFVYYKQGIKATSSKNKEVIVTIPKGSSGNDIIKILDKNKLIKSSTCAKIYLKLNSYDFKSNVYILNKKMDLKGRNFLTLKDFTAEEIIYLVDLAAELKEKKKKGIPVDTLRGKNVALIFEKTSTRTRCAFEVAAHDLGMGTTYLDPSGSQIGKKESIRDTARVLGRMFEGIEYRGFGQEIVEELAKYAGVPVWNGLTNEYHPTQMLADMLTIREHLGHLKGVKLVYMGDARYNMGNSLMIACAKLGMHFVACAPEKYFPNAALVEECQDYAKESGGSITLTEDVKVGTKDADVIYTDVWVSMGEPDEVWEERIRELTPYKVTKEVMENAGEKAIFLHCLPAFHDWETKIGKEMGERFNLKEMEVTDEVFESEQSVVFDEAENRMHTIKAVMAATLGA